jgi:hypothetical protein
MPHHTHEHFIRRISKMHIDPMPSDVIKKPTSMISKPGSNLPVKYRQGINWRWGGRQNITLKPSSAKNVTKTSSSLRRLLKLRHLAKLGSITGWGLLGLGATELAIWLMTRGDSELPPDKPEPTGDEIPEYSQYQLPPLDSSKQTISNVKLNPRTLEILKKYGKNPGKVGDVSGENFHPVMSRGGTVKQYRGGALVNKYILR